MLLSKNDQCKMTSKTRIWPVKSEISMDIVYWPAIIFRLALSILFFVFILYISK